MNKYSYNLMKKTIMNEKSLTLENADFISN